MIITRRHPFKFYLSVAFAFLFFCGLGSLLIFTFLDLKEKEKLEFKTYFMPFFGLLILIMAFYTLRQYYKNSPIIEVNKSQIVFGNEVFLLTDIKDIILTGKMPFNYLIKFPMEGAALEFRNGTIKFIYDDMYSNTWQLKSFLEKTVVEKKEFQILKEEKIDSDAIRLEQIDEFKGIQITSLRGICLWGIIGFFVFLLFSKGKSPASEFWIFFVVFNLFWFVLNSWLMHFFGVSKEFFIVKNHNLIWRKHIYRLNNIKEIVFETQGKMPNCLRVITNDYRNKLYPAGTLRDKTWHKLKKELEQKGINVRNECIY